MTSHCARTFPEDFGLGNFFKAITQVRQESQRAMFQMRKEDPKPKEKEKNVHGRGRPAKYIKPVIENFKRTKAGFKLVQQEVKRLLVDQTKKIPHKAMMDVNEEKVSFTQNGSTNTIKLTELLTKAPHFFHFLFDHSQEARVWTSGSQVVDRGSSPDVCFILFSGCICFVVVALAFHGIPGFVSIISIKFEVSSALKDGSTKELSGLVAQIASLKLPGNALEPDDVEDDPDGPEDSD